jgi:hypothetical protein
MIGGAELWDQGGWDNTDPSFRRKLVDRPKNAPEHFRAEDIATHFPETQA